MLSKTGAIDVRLLAAIAATLMLIGGVMWIVPTTPNSNSFTFDKARRDVSAARPIEMARPLEGMLVDGSDADFYRIDPLRAAASIDVHLMNGSVKLIPGLRVLDGNRELVVEKTLEYVQSPGTNADCSFQAQANMRYYVEVFGQRNTIGAYVLTVSKRER